MADAVASQGASRDNNAGYSGLTSIETAEMRTFERKMSEHVEDTIRARLMYMSIVSLSTRTNT